MSARPPGVPEWAANIARPGVMDDRNRPSQWGKTAVITTGGQERLIDIAFASKMSESVALYFEALDATTGLPVGWVDFIVTVGAGGTARNVAVLPSTTPYVTAGETIQVTASILAPFGGPTNVRAYASRTGATPTL